ncbi:hypothetical protein AAVH_34657, partial [Aphelenchoides avenae]
MLAALIVVPFAAAAIRLRVTTEVVERGGGYFVLSADQDVNYITGIISVAVALVSCTASAFLELRSVVVYRRLSTQMQRERHEDFRLLSMFNLLLSFGVVRHSTPRTPFAYHLKATARFFTTGRKLE